MVQVATQRKGSIGRYQPMGALVSFGSRTMAEMWVASGGPDIARQILELVEPLTLRVLEWNEKVLKESGLDKIPRESETNGLGRLGIPVALAVGGIQLAVGLINAGNSEKETKRLGFVKNAFNTVQPVLQEQSSRAIELLAAAGEPDAIAVLNPEEETGPIEAEAFVAEASRVGPSTTSLVIGGVGLTAAAAAAAVAFLRGLKRPRLSRRRRRKLGSIFTLIRARLEEVATAQQAALAELLQGNPPGDNDFDPTEFLQADLAGIGDIINLRKAAVRLGVANNRLADTLTRLADLGLPLKAPTRNGVGGRMGRSRRRRRQMRGMGFVPGSERALGRLGATNQEVVVEFVEENLEDAIGWFDTMRVEAKKQVGIAESDRQLKWAEDVREWSGTVLLLLRGFATESDLALLKSQTPRMTRHMRRVLKQQAAVFELLGRLDKAAATLAILDRFEAVVAASKRAQRDPTATASQGLSGLGVGLTTTLLITLGIAALFAVGAAFASVGAVTAARIGANALKNKDELSQELAERIVKLQAEGAELRAQGKTKEADAKDRQAAALLDVLRSRKDPLGFLEAASAFLANLTTLILVGAGVWVGFRFVIPGIRDLAARQRGAAPALTAAERAQAPPAEPRGKALSKGERKVFEALEARSDIKSQMLA